jgi:MFS family permease
MGSDVHLQSATAWAEAAVDFQKVPPEASLAPAIENVGSNQGYGTRPIWFRNTLQECLFVLTTTVAVGTNSIFGGAVLCMTNDIGRDLKMNSAEVTWLWAGQNLAAGSLLLLFGRVADLFGRRLVLLVSMMFFCVCSLIAGFATNAIFLDVFVGLIGVACAASVPPAIGKLGAVYDRPSYRKNRAFACFSAGYPVGFVLGAFIAGVTTTLAIWRASFWVTSVVYAFFTLAAWWTVPPDTEQRVGGLNRQTLSQFDFLGSVLAVAGIATFTASFSLAGDGPKGWGTSYVIALLVVGVLMIAACIYWQSVFKHPLMPLYIWKDRNFSLLVSILCLGFYGFSGNLFWISLVWQRIDGESPLTVAVRLLPAAIGGILVNVTAALIMHRVSNKLLMGVAAASLVVASALWSAISGSMSYWALSFPALIFSVVGADFQFTVTNMYVMSSLQYSDSTHCNSSTRHPNHRLPGSWGCSRRTRLIEISTISGDNVGVFGWGSDWFGPGPVCNSPNSGWAGEARTMRLEQKRLYIFIHACNIETGRISNREACTVRSGAGANT